MTASAVDAGGVATSGAMLFCAGVTSGEATVADGVDDANVDIVVIATEEIVGESAFEVEAVDEGNRDVSIGMVVTEVAADDRLVSGALFCDGAAPCMLFWTTLIEVVISDWAGVAEAAIITA